jgi:hypothetical protein
VPQTIKQWVGTPHLCDGHLAVPNACYEGEDHQWPATIKVKRLRPLLSTIRLSLSRKGHLTNSCHPEFSFGGLRQWYTER